jgi:glucose/mannose-6-phosphate isomerase
MRLSIETIERIDTEGMIRRIADFPTQVEEAVEIGARANLGRLPSRFSSIVMTGMGGSAIGGDLLRSYLLEELEVPFLVSRSYRLPRFVNRSSLVIISSYSGDTEETLSAYRDARKRGARILCLTTGGEVEKMARRNGHPCIKVVPGLQPRAALGYSFFPLLVVFSRLCLIRPRQNDVEETVKCLRSSSRILSNPQNARNKALALARAMRGKIPIIYSASDRFGAVNVRWRGQMSENAKQLAFGNVLPEMNHNEIAGWNVNRKLLKRMMVIFLRDREVHHRVCLREEATMKILRSRAAGVMEVWSEGSSLLTRIFSLVYLGDWVSYYLAILNKQNPTPVKAIEHLKGELSRM